MKPDKLTNLSVFSFKFCERIKKTLKSNINHTMESGVRNNENSAHIVTECNKVFFYYYFLLV